jgi:WD40 repeat protein
VAVGAGQGSVWILDPVTAAVRHRFQAYDRSKFGDFNINAIAGSPDGRLILAGVEGLTINGAFYGTAEQKAWSASLAREPVRMLRGSDGARVASLTAPKEPIREAAWDPKGRYVAILDNGGGLFIWRPPFSARSYEKITLGRSNTLGLAISPDGDRIAVPATDGVSVYQLSKPSSP